MLLLDLPPNTGDVAISAGHLVPGAELIVVTTPQLAASEVAERAGSLATQLHQRVVGVIENMAYLPCPHCDERIEVFGKGGGNAVAQALSRLVGTDVPVLGEIPIDLRLRELRRRGYPARAGRADGYRPHASCRRSQEKLARRSRSLVGRQPRGYARLSYLSGNAKPPTTRRPTAKFMPKKSFVFRAGQVASTSNCGASCTRASRMMPARPPSVPSSVRPRLGESMSVTAAPLGP